MLSGSSDPVNLRVTVQPVRSRDLGIIRNPEPIEGKPEAGEGYRILGPTEFEKVVDKWEFVGLRK